MLDLALTGFVFVLLGLGLRKPFLWVLAYLYIDILTPQRISWGLLASLPISLIAFVLAFAGWALLDDKRDSRFTLRQGLIALLLVYCGLTTLTADYPESAVEKWAWVWKALVFAIFLPLTLRTRLRIEAAALTIVLTVGAWRQRHPARKQKAPEPALSPWWPTFTLFWVCLQGAFGAWTVTMKLFPAIVTLHLIGGSVLLILLCVQAVHKTLSSKHLLPVEVPRGIYIAMAVTGLLVILQTLLGGWVSTNYAVLACTTFPTCQGSWWPAMDFSQGFQIWRELGLLKDGSHISFQALTAIHYVHRLAAYIVLAALIALAWRMHRAQVLRDQIRWLGGLTLLQFLTGLSNVVLDWPLVAAVLHTGGAAALLVVLTWGLAASRPTSLATVSAKADQNKVRTSTTKVSV